MFIRKFYPALVLIVILLMVISLSFIGCKEEVAEEVDEETSEEIIESESETANIAEETEASEPLWTKEFESTDKTFDPLEYEDSITFAQVREQYGLIPIIDREIKMAGNVKAFENIVWRQIADGYSTFAQDAQQGGVSIFVDTRSPLGENDEEGQLAIVKDQVRKQFDVIMLSPISDANCLPGVEEAHKAGIPVFSINNTFNGCDMFIGPNSKEQGILAAEWIAKTLNGDGKVAIITGMPKTDVTRNRTGGFEDWMKENAPGIEIVDIQNGDWDRSIAKNIAETWLMKYSDLDAIYCNNDVMAIGVIEAVKETSLKLNEDIYVIGTDGQIEAYESIKAGELAATVDFYPFYFGHIAAEVSYRALAGQDLPKVVWTPNAIVDSTNVNNPQAETLGWTTPQFE